MQLSVCCHDLPAYMNSMKKGTLHRSIRLLGGFKDNLYRTYGSFGVKSVDLIFHDNLLKSQQKRVAFNEQPFQKSDII